MRGDKENEAKHWKKTQQILMHERRGRTGSIRGTILLEKQIHIPSVNWGPNIVLSKKIDRLSITQVILTGY